MTGNSGPRINVQIQFPRTANLQATASSQSEPTIVSQLRSQQGANHAGRVGVRSEALS